MPRRKHRGKGTRSEKLRKALCDKDVIGGGKVLNLIDVRPLCVQLPCKVTV